MTFGENFDKNFREFRNLIKNKTMRKQEDKMVDTKSRYEVIADLEKRKRDLIVERDSLDDVLKSKERKLKDLKRDMEDIEEDIEDFKSKMKDKKETISELIKSVDESLNRFSKLNEKKDSK